ncbi:heme exporter protein CcmB [Sphingomonas morindae]|uniref:Heme exporter protein B n=1 Tax=Sphingomonas morindae TaxID=1541170 RepID=A0ABY4XBX4_9SPHN|nr:heme exporter protein CcmB [Sphingomonas morindae]USI74470.1 heme exporter protein CcmB [Sphingomonas morindae]
MRLVLRLAARDLRTGLAAAGLPIAFFLIAAALFPLAVGPDARLLARAGPGFLWLAALLTALLPVDRLIAPDHEAGLFDQLAARGIADELVAAARILGHWLSFGPPLLLAALPAAALLGLDARALGRLEVSLAIGTPALAALAVTVAALTAGLRGAGGLAGLLLLPLAVPLLIFGAADSATAPRLLAAAALVLLAGAPFAAGAALRALRA